VAHVNAGPQIARPVTALVARTPATLSRAATPALARRLALRLGHEWLPRAAWTVSRTGKPGLVGIALLFAAALFLVSTHLRLVGEVEAMRADLAATQLRARTTAPEKIAIPATAMRAFPARTDTPAMLRQLFRTATRARLAVDSARYEINATKSSGVIRYQIAFPVRGPYPQIREFIDATLATMPAVALNDLLLERKSIADGNVEARLRMTLYTRSDP
jgi:Tfp pilus assembly protein PilO